MNLIKRKELNFDVGYKKWKIIEITRKKKDNVQYVCCNKRKERMSDEYKNVDGASRRLQPVRQLSKKQITSSENPHSLSLSHN